MSTRPRELDFRLSFESSPGGTRTLRLLHLEDDPQDAELILGTLEADGFQCEEERVDTREAFQAALEGGRPFDLVLADYKLPSFQGDEALALARRLRPDLPFILISGKVGEELINEGRPIPPDLLPTLFHPFQRGPHPKGERNIGLGLYIVDQIAKAHRGRVEVRSGDADTHFTVRFPKHELGTGTGVPVH